MNGSDQIAMWEQQCIDCGKDTGTCRACPECGDQWTECPECGNRVCYSCALDSEEWGHEDHHLELDIDCDWVCGNCSDYHEHMERDDVLDAEDEAAELKGEENTMENDEEGWSPEKDKGPEEILKLGKKLIEQSGLLVKKEEPKSFSEMEALLKNAWEATKRIAPDAPPQVQSVMVANLTHTKEKTPQPHE